MKKKKIKKQSSATVPEPQWYKIRLWVATNEDGMQGFRVAHYLKSIGGNRSRLYFAYYDGPDSGIAIYRGSVGKFEFHFCPGNQRIVSKHIRKQMLKLKFHKTSVCRREGGPGSDLHAQACELVHAAYSANIDQKRWADIRHWMHNMLGYSYGQEIASYAASTWRYTVGSRKDSRVVLVPEHGEEDGDE